MNVDGREASMTGSDIVEYTLRLGDDALIAAQRLAEWSARAPEMEEDIALSNIALDQLGVARLLLSYAGEQSGRSEDDLAYLRDDADFRNCLLVELPNAGPNASPGTEGDFGVTMTKLLFLSAYQWLLYGDLSASADERLAAIAAKARKESAYHLDHSSQWMIRLGDGTDESHRRIQLAVTELWPYTHELCQSDELIERLAAAGIAAAPRPEAWRDIVTGILDKATVEVPADGWAPSGGRRGQHTEHLSYLLGELQVLHRAHPGARW